LRKRILDLLKAQAGVADDSEAQDSADFGDIIENNT